MSDIDKIIVAVYIVLSVGSGIAFRGRQKTVQDYFEASGEIRGALGTIIVGLSIAASLFSGTSFVSYPSTIYSNGPAILLTCLTFPLCWLVLRFWFLPRYFAHGGKTPFQILGDRLGGSVRFTASVAFILFRISWMSTLLYAPTVVFMTAAGMSEHYFWPFVIVVGLVCTISTTIGGLRGVMVTDALQFMLIFLGLVFVIGTQVSGLKMTEIISALAPKSGLWPHPLHFDLNFTSTYSLWAILIGFSASNLSSYMGDQMTLQRYLSLGDVNRASRSFGYNIVGIIAVSVLLGGIGILLRIWYSLHPIATLPTDPDRVLPFYIVQHLPIGVTGILLAALLAATMNCMSSGINSLAGSVINDLVAPRSHAGKPETLLRLARCASVGIGLFSILGVYAIRNLGTIWEISNRASGIFQGPLLAIMIIACVPEFPIPAWTVILGAVGGCVAGLLSIYWHIDSLWVTFLSFVGTIIVSYVLASIRGAFPWPPRKRAQ